MENLDKYRLFLIERKANKFDGTSVKSLQMNVKKDNYESFASMLKRTGLDKYIKITSSYRNPNDPKQRVGKHWRTSNHGKKNEHGDSRAYDIVPIGISFLLMEQLLRSTPEANQYLINNGYRLLNETTKKTMSATGATGKHFHLSNAPGSTEGVPWAINTKTKTGFNVSLPKLGTNMQINYVAPINTDFIPNDYEQQTFAEKPVIIDDNKIVNENNPVLLNDVIVTGYRHILDLPLFPYLDTYYELPLIIVLPQLFNLTTKQISLLLQAFNELARQLNDLNYLYGDAYDLYLTKEEADRKRQNDLIDLLFAEQMANINKPYISALGGLLYDNITRTYNPNNKVGDISNNSFIPSVRY